MQELDKNSLLDTPMTKPQLVERLRLIRKDVLKLSQTELAEQIGTKQVLISRMELKGKGTIDLLIDLLNFYEKKGIKSYIVLLPNFSIEMLTNDNSNKSEIDKLAEEVKTDVDQLIQKVKSML